jgi:hypothetical protein
LKYHHTERPHQGVGNRTLDLPEEPVILPFPKTAKVVRHERLGGLLKSSSRMAA